MNLIGSRTSAQQTPTANGMLGPALLFYSRFHKDGTIGVNVLAQEASLIPRNENPRFGICFPLPLLGIPPPRSGSYFRDKSNLVPFVGKRYDQVPTGGDQG